MKKLIFEDLANIFSRDINVRANIVPVIDAVDENLLLSDDSIENEMAVLPVMDQVLFPGVIIPIAAQRPKSRRLLNDVSGTEAHVAVFMQHTAADDPGELDLCPVGVVARVLRVFSFKEDITVAILQGITRCHSLQVVSKVPYLRGTVTLAPEDASDMESQAFRRKVKLLRKQYGELVHSRVGDDELGSMLTGIGSDKIFINFAATHMDIETESKYNLLVCDTYSSRVDRMLEHISTLKGLDELRREIDNKTREELERQQREYFLRQQMNVIQEELGDGSSSHTAEGDMAELRGRAENKQWPQSVAEVFEKELGKLGHIPPMSPDYSTQYAYLETLLDIPWEEGASEEYDIKQARAVMDRDHFGIPKVKERIIEYLAVRRRQTRRGTATKAQVL